MTAAGATYRARVGTGAPHGRTLWEEGRKPGRLVVSVAGLLLMLVVLTDLLISRSLSVAFDVAFVLVCVAAALAVRVRDFFVVGVLPPLLLAGTVASLAILARGSVADPTDGFLQAVVSGLAHHSGALAVGYLLTLAVLALRQVALRNSGTIRSHAHGRARASEQRRSGARLHG